MTLFRHASAAALLSVLLAACSDDLTESTALRGFVRDDVLIRDTTVVATSSGSFKQPLAMNGRLSQLGVSGSYEARTLIQFSAIPTSDTMRVQSATLTLRAETWTGPASGTLAFTVHKITGPWSAATTRWDSLPAFETAVRGSYSATVSADTQRIVVPLDTALVAEWIRPGTTQYGIILMPGAASTVVRGVHIFDFDSVSFYPTLQIIVAPPAGTPLDTATISTGYDTFVGNIDVPVSSPHSFGMQSGVVFRGLLSFDLSFIPRGAIVNTAELSLRLDPGSSRLTRFTSDSLLLAHVRTDSADRKRFESSSSSGAPSDADPTVYTFNIRHAAQSWTLGTNYGLVIRNSTLSEFSCFDLFAFYGHTDPDSTRRPRLRIRYAVFTEGGLR